MRGRSGYADHTWATTKDLACGRLRFVYALHHDVSWSMIFQETQARSLTEDVRKIVKSIEGSTDLLRKEIAEAERRAELRRQEYEAQHARWLIEEDQRQMDRSIKESREQLDQVIKSWATIIGIEQFLKGVQERASELSEDQRRAVLDRLQLARDFIGTQDPLDFFRAWKTPSERYLPLSMRKPKAAPQPTKV